MTSQTFNRYQCWRDDRISPVINKEALVINRANFMATHVPFEDIHYVRSPRQIPQTDEKALLEELYQHASENRHAFVVALGIPGTGKSHLIRWLQESYAAINRERGGNDVTLLVERASGSLRGTLRQLLQIDVLQGKAMSKHLDRLRGAADTLSNAGLDDSLINNLQVATKETQITGVEAPTPRIRIGIEPFLLDPLIREHLRQVGGPIERIRQHLTGGRQLTPDINDLPGFEPDDFSFNIQFLHQVKSTSYEPVRELAEGLNISPDLRRKLANYLNRLLNFAISRTTALSGEELKDMFQTVRQELRRQGRGLALFIEDIASFTGIDNGLIDALVTQHGINTDLCRMLSIVGITDSYYESRFPDNIKDRVTHQFTLNSSVTERSAQLLDKPEAIADFAARYLNAMRVTQEALDDWLEQGGHVENLPNACLECPYRVTCHDAFGSVNLAPGVAQQTSVGLYPFNQRAIQTMYENLDVARVPKTPRALLNSVLEYVLKSHGQKVAQGEFPPPAPEMGSEFHAPLLANYLHGATIDSQAGDNAQRVLSLLLFWGNGTADATVVENKHIIGDVSEAVFQAFDIPLIEGELSSQVVSKPSAKTSDQILPSKTTKSVNKPSGSTSPVPYTVATPDNQSSHVQSIGGLQEDNPYAQDISRWRAGAQLQRYRDLAEYLRNIALSYIDWECHGLSIAQAEERLALRFFYFVGQAGQPGARTNLEYERSGEMESVLLAAVDLSRESGLTEPGKIGRHLAVLSSWVRKQEPRLVDFVRNPGSINPEMSLFELTITNALILACLDGYLAADRADVHDLFLDLIKSCASGIDRTATGWRNVIEQSGPFRSSLWSQLVTGINSEKVKTCRERARLLLNCPQGASQDVRYVDAPRALDTIRQLQQSDWQLSPVKKPETGASKMWDEAYAVYTELQTSFARVLAEEKRHVQALFNQLMALLDGQTTSQVLKAIHDTLSILKQAQWSYTDFEDKPIDAHQEIDSALQTLRTVSKVVSREYDVLCLSQCTADLRIGHDYQEYFEYVRKVLVGVEAQLSQRIGQLKSETQSAEMEQEVISKYSTIIENLSRPSV